MDRGSAGGAWVRTETPLLGSGVSNAEGEFAVDGLDAAAQVLVVQRPGLGRLVHVVDSRDGEDLGDLVLPPRCEIDGTVTDEGGARCRRGGGDEGLGLAQESPGHESRADNPSPGPCRRVGGGRGVRVAQVRGNGMAIAGGEPGTDAGGGGAFQGFQRLPGKMRDAGVTCIR